MKRLLVVLLLLSSSIAQAETKISDEAIKAVQTELARATKAGEIEGGMILVHVHGEQVLLDIKGIHDSEDGLQFKENSLL